jgi:hypothetical protein
MELSSTLFPILCHFHELSTKTGLNCISEKSGCHIFFPKRHADKDFATKGSDMVTAILVIHAKFSFSAKVFQPITSNI